MESMIKLKNVNKYFTEHKAVNNISIDVMQGEFLTLLGPSGCGKTTTLRMIAGFEEPTSGQILLDGVDVSFKHPYERDVNTVFQNYALFPNMNIFNNIAFGLKIKKLPKKEIEDKVTKALSLVQLDGYKDRYPSQLSGGQKQRIAIARAVVNSPKVLLLDEPLGALDLKLRKQMQFELKHLQRRLGITFIYVTHDQEEALTMSDRIAVMNQGEIEQIGTPDDIYDRPKTKFVADFIGETNLFEGVVKEHSNHKIKVSLEDEQDIEIIDDPSNLSKLKHGDKIYITIRPERMKLSYNKEKEKNTLEGKVKERIFVGSINKTVVILSNGKEVIVNEPAVNTLKLNGYDEEVCINWEFEDGVVIS
jgi:spermidine/putrescine transport system ATP-binding protein